MTEAIRGELAISSKNKLKAEVAELEEKNQTLLKEKHQLIEVRLDTDSINRLSHQC